MLDRALAPRLALVTALIGTMPACEPVALLPPPGPPRFGAPRLELREDGSYVKDGRLSRAKLSDLVIDHPEARALALEYEHDQPIGYRMTIAGLSVTVTGMATALPGLLARNDPVAIVGGVHIGVGLCVLVVTQIIAGSARWERRRAIDLYNEAPAPLLSPPPQAPSPAQAP